MTDPEKLAAELVRQCATAAIRCVTPERYSEAITRSVEHALTPLRDALLAALEDARERESRVMVATADDRTRIAALISIARQFTLDAALAPMRNDHLGTWAAFEDAIARAAAVRIHTLAEARSKERTE